MRSKRDLLKRSCLCVILDRAYLPGEKIFKVARGAILGGASLIQIRDKSSSTGELIKVIKKLKAITKKRGIPLIANDRADAAVSGGADGLHIGQGDIGARLARKLIGKDKILGVSVDNFNQALKAKQDGADYIAVGPIFKTPVKKEKKQKGVGCLAGFKKSGIPCFAIGGVDTTNVAKLAAIGITNIAVIRAVSCARDPRCAAKRLKEALN